MTPEKHFIYQLVNCNTGIRSQTCSGTEKQVYEILKKQSDHNHYFLVLCEDTGEFSLYPLMRISSFIASYEHNNSSTETETVSEKV